MKRRYTVEFWESFLPTRRHRIPHWRKCQEQVTVEFPRISLAEAPVAIRQKAPPGGGLSYSGGGRGHKRHLDYHWYAGKLYTRVRLGNFLALNRSWCGEPDLKDRFATVHDIYWSQPYQHHQNRDDALAALAARMDQFRIIGGHLCQEIDEPRYVVMTFGLGHNHGGTALMVDHGFNSNILTERYYRIDQEAEANAAALAIATRRGDTKNIPGLLRRHYERFEILIPEAVRMQRQDHGPDDEFTQQIARITDSGFPQGIAAFALLGVAHSIAPK